MRPDPSHKAPRRSGPCPRSFCMVPVRGHGPLLQKQRGFGLVAAMFLIIVIAGAIAAMWRISVIQTATSSLALQQARAYQAARAGVEWGIYRFLNDASCPSSVTFTVPQLDGFKVEVECSASSSWRVEYNDLLEERLESTVIQKITATAEYSVPGNPDYAYRKLTAEVEKAGVVAGLEPEEPGG